MAWVGLHHASDMVLNLNIFFFQFVGKGPIVCHFQITRKLKTSWESKKECRVMLSWECYVQQREVVPADSSSVDHDPSAVSPCR